MKKTTLTLALIAFSPMTASAQSLQVSLPNFVTFLNDIVIPFLLGVGFLFVVINTVRFFVIGGSNEEGRDKAKALAIYSVAAFVFIIIFWGIVNMLSESLGLDGCSAPIFDYMLHDPTYSGPYLPTCT